MPKIVKVESRHMLKTTPFDEKNSVVTVLVGHLKSNINIKLLHEILYNTPSPMYYTGPTYSPKYWTYDRSIY